MKEKSTCNTVTVNPFFLFLYGIFFSVSSQCDGSYMTTMMREMMGPSCMHISILYILIGSFHRVFKHIIISLSFLLLVLSILSSSELMRGTVMVVVCSCVHRRDG